MAISQVGSSPPSLSKPPTSLLPLKINLKVCAIAALVFATIFVVTCDSQPIDPNRVVETNTLESPRKMTNTSTGFPPEVVGSAGKILREIAELLKNASKALEDSVETLKGFNKLLDRVQSLYETARIEAQIECFAQKPDTCKAYSLLKQIEMNNLITAVDRSKALIVYNKAVLDINQIFSLFPLIENHCNGVRQICEINPLEICSNVLNDCASITKLLAQTKGQSFTSI